MAELLTADALISLFTLTLLEIVLGIDNIIFISIVAGKLPDPKVQDKARKIGIILALFARVGLLFGITWIIGLKADLFTVLGIGFSGRDLILLGGGLFLIGKTVSEIHEKLEGTEETIEEGKKGGGSTLGGIIIQIILVDIVFSFDSILTAVGLVDNITIMIIAVVISMAVMYFFARSISDFVHNHPTVKMLALSFLIMIGFLLVVEAFDVHVNKGFAYFAMAFALGVEFLNMKLRKKGKPVQFKDDKMPPPKAIIVEKETPSK